jgi:hypothetical protein
LIKIEIFGRLPLSTYALKCFVILFLSLASIEFENIGVDVKKNTNIDMKILINFPYNL